MRRRPGRAVLAGAGVLLSILPAVAAQVLLVLVLLRCAVLAGSSDSGGSSRMVPADPAPAMSFVSARSIVSIGLYSASPSYSARTQTTAPPPGRSSSSVNRGTPSMEFVKASDLLSGRGAVAALDHAFGLHVAGHRPAPYRPRRGSMSSAQRVKRVGRYRGWKDAGPGRRQGGGFYPRDILLDVFVVMLCTELHGNLVAHFDNNGVASRARLGLRRLRERYLHVTDKALRTRAWMMGRSGCMGMLLKLNNRRLDTDYCKDVAVAVSFTSNGKGGVKCCCSAEEQCLDTNCGFQIHLDGAMKLVVEASQMKLVEVLSVLEASVRGASNVVGTAVRYGSGLYVVRRGQGSWPYAVVRKTLAKQWVCVACPTAGRACGHRSAAYHAAEVDPIGGDNSDDEGVSSPRYPDDPDGEPPPPANPYVLQSRFFETHRSRLPRDLVAPSVAQQARLDLVDAARSDETVTEYPANPMCPYCKVGPLENQRPIAHPCRVDFDDGSTVTNVFSWRCSLCRLRVLPDGRKHGIVFVSASTAFSEAFLFELAVNLSRNGSSLRSSAYLREGFNELTASLKYKEQSCRLRSVTTLRKGLLLYLSLVIKGLPLAVSTCSNCVGDDGCLDIICFDGLQLGYKIKYKRPFKRFFVRTSAIPRASLHAHLVTDTAVAKALGTVLNTSTSLPVGSSRTVTTVGGVRGYVMAVGALLGDVAVDGEVKTFAGSAQHGLSASSAGRGWCPSKDGGVRRELMAFYRRFFQCDSLARSLCVQIVAANGDLRRRVPPALLARVGAVLTAEPLGVEPADGPAVEHVDDEDAPCAAAQGDASRDGVPEETGKAHGVKHSTPSEGVAPAVDAEESDGVEECDGDLSSADEDESETDQADVAKPSFWDKLAPLEQFAELFCEPALADTGGEKGTKLKADMLFRLRPEIPTTAAATLKIVDFVRALTVDPVMVWAPNNNWGAVNAIHRVLVDKDFTADKLATTLEREDVCNLRLLRGAVACLGPAFVEDQSLRVIFAGLLLAFKSTADSYQAFVDAACAQPGPGGVAGADDGAGDKVPQPGLPSTSKAQMACAPDMETFTPEQFAETWLKLPASVQSFREAYGISDEETEDYLQSGVWAPSFPVVRPMPVFFGNAAAATDEPECAHLMGQENRYTGGTFGAFCTCTHPKCVGVVVLDGSEGQRMPIEFIVQRCKRLPFKVVYDFSCATMKSGLCRMPFIARTVAFLVDRFHWMRNHVACSKAMNPDSYSDMDGVNTSSSEERNALSRRQEHHLRLMNQDNFITFTTYQQALSNAIAMYRDVETKLSESKWPRWYREMFVDVVGNTERDAQ